MLLLLPLAQEEPLGEGHKVDEGPSKKVTDGSHVPEKPLREHAEVVLLDENPCDLKNQSCMRWGG